MNTRTLTQVIAEPKTVKNWILLTALSGAALGALIGIYLAVFHFYIFLIGVK